MFTFNKICMVVSCLLMMFFAAEVSAGSPVKIAVSTESNSVWTGEQSTLEVQLLDADNKPAESTRLWDLVLEVTASIRDLTHRVELSSSPDHDNHDDRSRGFDPDPRPGFSPNR